MEESIESVGETVKQFLSSNGSASSSRSTVVFDRLFVEGSGRGVSKQNHYVGGQRNARH